MTFLKVFKKFFVFKQKNVKNGVCYFFFDVFCNYALKSDFFGQLLVMVVARVRIYGLTQILISLNHAIMLMFQLFYLTPFHPTFLQSHFWQVCHPQLPLYRHG